MDTKGIITKEMELIFQDEFLRSIADDFDVIRLEKDPNTIRFAGNFNRDLIAKINDYFEVYWKVTEKECVQACGTHWVVTEEGYVNGRVNLKIENTNKEKKEGQKETEEQEKKYITIILDFMFS